MVKYELIYGQLGSSGQVQMRPDGEVVQGVALCQVLADRKLKFEAVPGLTSGQVKGFSQKAKVYER